jgi:hypothetical protein
MFAEDKDLDPIPQFKATPKLGEFLRSYRPAECPTET